MNEIKRMSKISVKRVYEPASENDGYRILVDRLWPRGLAKTKTHVDEWLKDVAPSNELRKWFNHEAEKWTEFKKSYKAELKESNAIEILQPLLKKYKHITLLFGAKDEGHNQAIVLKEYLENILKKK